MIGSYKDEHETFVSNGKGTSVMCVFICLAHAPALIYGLKVCQQATGPNIFRDICFMTIPAVLTLTVLAEFNHITALFLYFLVAVHRVQKYHVIITESENNAQPFSHIATNHLTLYKGLNVLLTCISILAVDFTIFPRNFAKTETIGLSLMDIGVGTFMISSALTSKYARGITTASTAISVGTFRKLSLQHLLVLLLGVGRFVALKVLNYQEHVSEYGVHWNFFVTLFCVWTVADVVHRTVPRSHIFWISLLWLLLYQIVLIHTPLTAFIFSSERSGLLSANKEGIVSLMGYIPLFLLTEVLAHILFYKPKNVDSVPVASTGTKKEARELDSGHLEDDTDNNPSNLNSALAVNGDTVVSKWDFKMMQKMAYCSLVLWLAWLVANTVQQTSRRLVNLSYVSLVLALTMTTLLMLYVSDTLSGGPNVPVLTLQYLSKHSLLVFLAANVLTGAINMSMHTIYASTPVAFAILLAYSITVTCIAWIAEHVMAPKIDKVRI